MMKLARFNPKIIESIKGYSGQTFVSDLSSGLTVGVIALPLSIAFAIASGLKPEADLFQLYWWIFNFSFRWKQNSDWRPSWRLYCHYLCHC